jgi:RNA-binding protein NOB1
MQNWAGGPSVTDGTTAGSSTSHDPTNHKHYRAIVVDSGPIIKETNIRQWMGRADRFYTVPTVVDEIRDAKARNQLEQQWIPLLGLEVKIPSSQALHRVVEFSKLTGDYPSLSSVDLQVLALVIDLELEGCYSLEHLRVTPKRTIGLGTITTLNKDKQSQVNESEEKKEGNQADHEVDYEISEEEEDSDDSSEDDEDDEDSEEEKDAESPARSPPPLSWAKLVNPVEGSESVHIDADPISAVIVTPMESLAVTEILKEGMDEISAADGDVARELEREFPSLAAASTVPYEGDEQETAVDDHSLTTTSPMETLGAKPKIVRFGEDVLDGEKIEEARAYRLKVEHEERERRKQEALKPISKSGKLYNSFRNYGNLVKAGPAKRPVSSSKSTVKMAAVAPAPDEQPLMSPGHSRILGAGGSAMVAGPNMKAEDDDGEGWITSTQHMGTLKSLAGGGPLDPIKVGSAILPDDVASGTPSTEQQTPFLGPVLDQRTACTTTDFAMQNVLLQMGLILLSVDGMQIRRLKSWVLRCGACFKIHTDPVDPKTGMRRMFCAHCGSDRVQRVSASVDGKTGRLKLYFSKRKRNKYMSARGMKYSLPKPGTGNRFQGDLLLREDQLLMGAWQQKVKKNKGGQSRAHTESIFGKDIASNVGCGVTSMPNDIQVGFGRRNPNAAKGRERRGKKKKSTDRACGLRRY